MLHTETDTMYAVGKVIVFIIIGICLVGGIVLSIAAGMWSPGIMGIVIAALAFGVWFILDYPPFAMQYHTYQPTTITVKKIANRILNDGNGTISQRVAIQAANGNIYGCDDTRCETLQAGQVVTLLCRQDFETNGVPGYVCNWGKLGRN